jgi:hypothetical protein
MLTAGEHKMTNIFNARREQMLRELASNLADLVEAGELTDTQANEWLASKADQWSGSWFN